VCLRDSGAKFQRQPPGAPSIERLLLDGWEITKANHPTLSLPISHAVSLSKRNRKGHEDDYEFLSNEASR